MRCDIYIIYVIMNMHNMYILYLLCILLCMLDMLCIFCSAFAPLDLSRVASVLQCVAVCCASVVGLAAVETREPPLTLLCQFTPLHQGLIHKQLKASYTSSLRPHPLVGGFAVRHRSDAVRGGLAVRQQSR